MIHALGFMDVSRLSASFTMMFAKQMVDSRDALHTNVRSLTLRDNGEPVDLGKQWKTADGFLTRLRGETAPLFQGKPPSFGDVVVRCLSPGGRVDWHIDRGPDHYRSIYICLNPSPGGVLFSGGTGVCPAVGNVLLPDRGIIQSEINLGPCPMVMLVAELFDPDQGDDSNDTEREALEQLEG